MTVKPLLLTFRDSLLAPGAGATTPAVQWALRRCGTGAPGSMFVVPATPGGVRLERGGPERRNKNFLQRGGGF